MLVFDSVVQEFILQMAITLVSLFIPPMAYFITRLIVSQARVMKAKLTAEQLMLLETLAHSAVKAAEQAGMSGYISDQGKSKRDWAVKWLDGVTKRIGLTEFNEEDFIMAIEASIREGVQMKEPPAWVPPVDNSNNPS
jgi:hypothetical protein